MLGSVDKYSFREDAVNDIQYSIFNKVNRIYSYLDCGLGICKPF